MNSESKPWRTNDGTKTIQNCDGGGSAQKDSPRPGILTRCECSWLNCRTRIATDPAVHKKKAIRRVYRAILFFWKRYHRRRMRIPGGGLRRRVQRLREYMPWIIARAPRLRGKFIRRATSQLLAGQRVKIWSRGFHYNWKHTVRRDNASEKEATHLGGEYARIEIAQYAKPGIGRVRSIAELVNKSRTHVNNPNVKYRF
jgi:hypothetical protein